MTGQACNGQKRFVIKIVAQMSGYERVQRSKGVNSIEQTIRERFKCGATFACVLCVCILQCLQHDIVLTCACSFVFCKSSFALVIDNFGCDFISDVKHVFSFSGLLIALRFYRSSEQQLF